MSTYIAAFEQPPGSDEEFEALYRALRADVALRFVAVSSSEFAHARAYELVHEDGEPDAPGGAVLITPFEVPAGGDEDLVSHWARLRGLFAPRQGYLGSRLYHSTGPADFRYVAIVRWSSPLMYARTLQQPEIAQAVADMPFPGRPALYLRTS